MPTPVVSIDKSIFIRYIKLFALNIPAILCTHYTTNFKNILFQRPRLKRIHNVENDNSRRLLLLSEEFISSNSEIINNNEGNNNNVNLDQSFLPENLRIFNEKNQVSLELYTLKLDYDHFSVEEVLKTLLPNDIKEIPSSFEQAGHIAHLNLRDEMVPYKYIIGQAILDKNPAIKTIVNKTGSIETVFRTFPMELLAGDNNYNVTLKESNARFSFNFGEVYWNSRLQMEHERLIKLINKTPVLKAPSSSSSNTRHKPTIVADMMVITICLYILIILILLLYYVNYIGWYWSICNSSRNGNKYYNFIFIYVFIILYLFIYL
jgi:tRNA (guanine37-N1)-methyltransferase